MNQTSILSTAFKNPLVALFLALVLVLGDWWVNNRRLDAAEGQIQRLQMDVVPRAQSDERYAETMKRLDRIEEKLDRHMEQHREIEGGIHLQPPIVIRKDHK